MSERILVEALASLPDRRTADRRISPAIGEYAIQQIPPLGAEIDRLRAANARLVKAAEFAEYMAKSAEAYLEATNAVGAVLVAINESEKDDDGDAALQADMCRAEESQSEAARGLRNDIYEFRKRAP